jgi:hypothetical protein
MHEGVFSNDLRVILFSKNRISIVVLRSKKLLMQKYLATRRAMDIVQSMRKNRYVMYYVEAIENTRFSNNDIPHYLIAGNYIQGCSTCTTR